MNVIETKGLTKYYGKSRGIIDLNLSVTEGEFFGFIGPNGAGKSTTIRTLLGLIKKSSGSAEIFGRNVEKNKKEILCLLMLQIWEQWLQENLESYLKKRFSK